MNFNSAQTFRHSDWSSMQMALINRRGRIVNENNHASRQAKKPNHRICSSLGQTLIKFNRRSILTLDDSYGKSLTRDR